MGSLRAFQLEIIFWAFTYAFLKFMFKFSSLLSISIPNSLKLSTHLTSRSGQILHPGLKNIPYGMTFVLSRFAASPEIDLKSSIYFIQAHSDSSYLLIKIVVSSAKVCAWHSFLSILIPCIFFVCVIFINKISTAMININRDIINGRWSLLVNGP